MMPPAAESLYYEILRGLRGDRRRCGRGRHQPCRRLESGLRLSPSSCKPGIGCGLWIDALRLWQDGIGVVPERSNRDSSAPRESNPKSMLNAREVLVWAFSRVARRGEQRLDGPGDLSRWDLWSATGEDTIHFFWHDYTWRPDFTSAKLKADTSRRQGSKEGELVWMGKGCGRPMRLWEPCFFWGCLSRWPLRFRCEGTTLLSPHGSGTGCLWISRIASGAISSRNPFPHRPTQS